MQAHRHLKLAVICTVALALPASAAAGTGSPWTPRRRSSAKVYRDVCPINNPDYTGPKPLPPLIDVSRRGACSLYIRSRP